jgi:hypothetical protein
MIAAAATDAAPYKHLLIDRSWHHLIRVAAVYNFDRSRTISLLAPAQVPIQMEIFAGTGLSLSKRAVGASDHRSVPKEEQNASADPLV